MADYNDGGWHGHNGGECPVHPKTEIEVVMVHLNGNMFNNTGLAAGFSFSHGDGYVNLIVFRVTKPYVEPPKPREAWALEQLSGLRTWFYDEPSARRAAGITGQVLTRFLAVPDDAAPSAEPAPKPLERWVNVYPDDRSVLANLSEARARMVIGEGGRTVLFREVMPDE